jgi:hypothetical protein
VLKPSFPEAPRAFQTSEANTVSVLLTLPKTGEIDNCLEVPE